MPAVSARGTLRFERRVPSS